VSGRIGIDNVSPVISGGQYPSKAVVAEHIAVRATVWRDGHDAVAATVVWTSPDGRSKLIRMLPLDPGLDTWQATVVPDQPGMWTFRVDGWSDPWTTWRHAVEAKVVAGQGAVELANDLETGARLLDWAARRPKQRRNSGALAAAAKALRDPTRTLGERVGPALHENVQRIMHAEPVRELITRGSSSSRVRRAAGTPLAAPCTARS